MLTGDYDPDGDAMVLAISYNGTSQSVGVSFQTTYGTFYVDNTGAYTFVIGPGAKALGNGQVANEIIQYTLSDNKGGMAVSHLTITITGTNSVPIVESVTTGTPVNVVLTGNLLDHYAFDWEPTPGLSISSYTVETIAGTHAAGSSTTITGIGTIMIQANGIYSFTPVTDYTGPVPRIRYTVTDGANNVTAFLSISVNPLISVNGPTVLFTDIVSGPVGTGDGQSAYLRIFGKNFGVTADLGTNTKVFIGGVEVEHYYHITNSRTYSKNGIVRLCVRVGALTGLTLGEPYPIVVQVNGISSNANCTFIPNPGKIWYISRAGSDGTAVAGDITKPGRNYELADRTGMLHKMVPGDMLVDIGDDTFSDTGFETCLVKFYDEIGSVPTGIAGTGWYAFVAHPDHQPHYSCPPGASGGFHGPSSSRSGLAGEFWAVSGYVMDVQGGALQNAGPINGEYTGGHIRVVDCELGPWIVGSSPVLNCAGVAGAGEWVYVLGNYIHDIGGTSDLQNHGIYADTSAYGWFAHSVQRRRGRGWKTIDPNRHLAGFHQLRHRVQLARGIGQVRHHVQ
jgi:VCBS repeat-containing protein